MKKRSKKPVKTPIHVSKLKKLNACSDAVLWSRSFKKPQLAWDACERGDWMLWLLGKQAGPVGSNSRKRLLAVACEVARLTLPYTKNVSVKTCIETTEAYMRGEVSIAAVQQARADAAAAYAAAAYAADAAAYAYAAAAAYAAAYAAYTAYAAYAYAAYTAYAAAAAAAAARKSTLDKSAQIVRKYYPEAPKL